MSSSTLDIRPIFPVWLIWLVRLLALAAAALSAYIAWSSVQAVPLAGCSPSGAGACHEVLETRWSLWLGLSVAMIGASCYGSIFALSWFVNLPLGGIQRAAIFLMSLLLLMAAGAALWFLALQSFYLGAFCPLCVSVHAMGLAAASLVFVGLAKAGGQGVDNRSHLLNMRGTLALPSGQNMKTSGPMVIDRSLFVLPAVLAGLGLAVFIGGQFLFPSDLPAIPGALANDGEAMVGERLLAAERPAESSYSELTGAASASDSDGSFDVGATATFSDSSDEAGSGVSQNDETVGSGLPVPPAVASPEGRMSDSLPNEARASSTPDPAAAEPEITAYLPAPDQHRTISFLDGRLTIDLAEHAVIGPRDAPHVVLELFDYTCLHCRRMQPYVRMAEERYRGQVAIVLMPVPLDGSCNPNITRTALEHRGACEMAKLSLALALMDQSAFYDMHYWLMEDEARRPMLDSALTRAFQRVDSDRFRTIRISPALETRLHQYMQLAVDLEKRAPDGKPLGLPILVVGDEVMSGSQGSAQKIYEVWERSFGISPTGL